AREQTVATVDIAPGSVIISVEALATALLQSEKQNRCDFCYYRRPGLRKCTACGCHWYCDETCQRAHWKLNHKKICKNYSSLSDLNEHERMDAILLSHLIAQLSPEDLEDATSAASVFASLLPARRAQSPVRCLPPTVLPSEVIAHLYARFSNNNFVMHSNLNTFGHGIFPLASRLFNHSCVPNAIPVFNLTSSRPVMNVIALRKIYIGEEICLPYLDPALLQMRRQMLGITYGFQCWCQACCFLQCIPQQPTPVPHANLAKGLVDFVESNTTFESTDSNGAPIPPELYPAFQESYITELSSTFSEAAHLGPYEKALEVGRTLLCLYKLIYVPTYPQTGMHLLEMAKVAWNTILTSGASEELFDLANTYLQDASEILAIIGPEGDDTIPLDECATLRELLATE
ncbi:SET domain-containing protein, partial [Fistulina hepatica ATCC 64428]